MVDTGEIHRRPLLEQVERLQEENARLREALGEYGAHNPDCLALNISIHRSTECTCGLRAASG